MKQKKQVDTIENQLRKIFWCSRSFTLTWISQLNAAFIDTHPLVCVWCLTQQTSLGPFLPSSIIIKQKNTWSVNTECHRWSTLSFSTVLLARGEAATAFRNCSFCMSGVFFLQWCDSCNLVFTFPAHCQRRQVTNTEKEEAVFCMGSSSQVVCYRNTPDFLYLQQKNG